MDQIEGGLYMIKLYENGVYLLNGTEIVEDTGNVQVPLTKEEAAQNTMAYGILKAHNTSENMERLQIRFDKLTSHDITFVGIIQTARASGLEKFPMPYVLTNCHNSLSSACKHLTGKLMDNCLMRWYIHTAVLLRTS